MQPNYCISFILSDKPGTNIWTVCRGRERHAYNKRVSTGKTKDQIETAKSNILKLNNSIVDTSNFIAKIKTLQLDFDEVKEIEKKYIEIETVSI